MNVARHADRIVRLLDDAYDDAPRLVTVDDEWRMFRGNPARNAEADWEGRVGGISWVVRSEDADEEDAENILTGYHPLAIAGRILLRTPNGQLTAVDPATGKIVWEYPYEFEREPVSETTQTGMAVTYTQPDRARELRWKDAVCGQLSSDGRRVYLVDGATIHQSSVGSQLHVGRQVRSRIWSSPHNRLVALNVKPDVSEAWSVGGPGGEDESGLAGTFFLGPPVIGNGRLYALVEMQGVVMLVALQAESGRLIWSQSIAYPKMTVSRDWQRRVAGATPSLAEGVVVCPTSAGAVVAVDALTGRLLWGYRYPRSVKTPDNRTHIALQLMGHTVEQPARWADAVATIADGRVLVTSADSDELLCLDLFTGKLEWANERGSMLYVAGVGDGNVFLVGERGMTAVSLVDGTPAWPKSSPEFPDKSQPTGRGLHVGSEYYLPTSGGEILKINLADGQLMERIKAPNVPGNLLGLGDRLVWQSAAGVCQVGCD